MLPTANTYNDRRTRLCVDGSDDMGTRAKVVTPWRLVSKR